MWRCALDTRLHCSCGSDGRWRRHVGLVPLMRSAQVWARPARSAQGSASALRALPQGSAAVHQPPAPRSRRKNRHTGASATKMVRLMYQRGSTQSNKVNILIFGFCVAHRGPRPVPRSRPASDRTLRWSEDNKTTTQQLTASSHTQKRHVHED